jgi:hypothetical protein
VLGDALEGVLLGRVPHIELFPQGEPLAPVERILVRSTSYLVWPIENAQDVDGRRVNLAVNDEVAKLRRVGQRSLPKKVPRSRTRPSLGSINVFHFPPGELSLLAYRAAVCSQTHSRVHRIEKRRSRRDEDLGSEFVGTFHADLVSTPATLCGS